MKVSSKLIFVLMLSLALVGLSGCAEKDQASSEAGKKTTEAKAASTTETKATTTTDSKKAQAADPKKQENQEKPTNQENQEKEIHDFVLENTKIVQVSNISRRVHEKHPDLGPFYVVRGIDVRGQKSEVWIKDQKIFEMKNTK